MRLNLPIYDQLDSCENLLIAGMGGGFDVFCGLPIYFEMKARGKTVHLANLSFLDAWAVVDKINLTLTCNGITAYSQGSVDYFPEGYLSRYFREIYNEEVVIWQFERKGTVQLIRDYQTLTQHLSIDGIVLVDGGVDSLIQGDESDLGTPLEDFASLYAVSQLDSIPLRMIACVGFGAEREVHHTHILENIATLTKYGGFLGSCSALKLQRYLEAVEYVHGQANQQPSVINTSLVSSIRGEYGDFHLTERTRNSQLWINPLMAIYWFFDLATVAEHNLLMPDLAFTEDRSQLYRAISMGVLKYRQRKRMKIPLK